jgi:hypothetical protein
MIKNQLMQQLTEIQNDLNQELHPTFDLSKKEVLDYSFQFLNMNRVVELGGVGEIDCAYGFYALNKFKPAHLTMVDLQWTENAKRLCVGRKEITMMKVNFGDPKLPAQIGNVDTVILFDVLLHQVAPNWDQILEIYAPYTKSFIIVNPQFMPSTSTIRLLDLGKEEYFNNVPHPSTHPTYSNLFSRLNDLVVPGRTWRDAPNIWQWGITNKDLLEVMHTLGFQLAFLKNYGQWQNLSNFDHHAYLFYKK